MSKPKHKKRHPQEKHSYTPTPVAESEFANDSTRKQMNPTARRLLFLALICLALSEILLRMQLMPETVCLVIDIVALIAFLAALYLQFCKPGGGSQGRPRL